MYTGRLNFIFCYVFIPKMK